MPIEILMPALSPTMTEGNLVAWLKNEGDQVAPGEVIAEIETDKATMEVEAVDEGRLGKIFVLAGSEGVAVNAVIAVLLEEGEDASDIGKPAETNTPKKIGKTLEYDEKDGQITSNQTEHISKISNPEPSIHSLKSSENRIIASPLAKRMAEHSGIDLTQVSGSGPNGRIIKADIDSLISGDAVRETKPSSTIEKQDRSLLPEHKVISNSTMRKVIARRLTEAKQTAPHFYMTVDCEIDGLLKVRQELNEKIEGGKISLNDFVIRASALAMQEVPEVNASWTEDATLIFDNVDISVAVAVDGGLMTPIIRNAGAKGLKQIASEMKGLAERARKSDLMPEEYQGGTFSISNLGMYGVKEFAAVINPPQGAILAVGVGEQRAVVKDGAVTAATVMSCTLSVDHRVVDGAVGAKFLSAFKKLIEDPLMMLL